jgi:hypothetical protein
MDIDEVVTFREKVAYQSALKNRQTPVCLLTWSGHKRTSDDDAIA